MKNTIFFMLLSLGIVTANAQNYQGNWSSFKEKYGTINFSYPSGWEVEKVDKSKSTAFNENYYMQPKGQVFSGSSGQVVIRIFDPMYVMEKSQSMSSTFSLSLFKNFNAKISDGNTSAIQLLNANGIQYYEVHQQGDEGFETRTIGVKSPRGNMYVLCIAVAPKLSGYYDNMLLKIAASLSGAEPSAPTASTDAVKNWYKALSGGNDGELKRLSCESARQSMDLTSILTSILNAPGLSDLASMGTSYDYSNLQYYTIAGNDQVGAVRACGMVVYPNGKHIPFSSYVKNVFVVKKESGYWKICGPL